uniref:Succinyl-diaminopimelate desuccinylase n=1 Tax=Pseudoalteromonas rubra TaxID=43658 RepID=A0A0F4QV13_9GAMM|nr:succinyl-diaminopimelate desuccinylase [Pseudoalteromonas rubra]
MFVARETDAICYAQRLVAFESVTPSDGGSHQWLRERLEAMGASVEECNRNGVSNLIACIDKGEGMNLAFCGHTDVVPAGNMQKWSFAPFSATLHNGYLYGRGVADMKGAIAAALDALAYWAEDDAVTGKFWMLITSDEEGEAEFGSREIINLLRSRGVTLDYCIVGEPTADRYSGDLIKIGRRGSVSMDIDLYGKSGHVAYPEQGVNAVHKMSQVVAQLAAIDWQDETAEFNGTSLQVTYINSGCWTDNVIPEKTSISLNVRYAPTTDEALITEKVTQVIREIWPHFELKSYRSCVPYHSVSVPLQHRSLIGAAAESIRETVGIECQYSTSGGTSDGRFFQEISHQVIELGLPNKTIHQENERVAVTEIENLAKIYKQLFSKLTHI